MRLRLFLLAFLLIPSAIALDSLKVTTTIEGDTAYIDYIALSRQEVVLPAAIGAQIVYARDEFGDAPAYLNGSELYIASAKPIAQGEQRTFIAKIKAKTLITDKGDLKEYAWRIELKGPAQLDHILLLPENATLVDPSPRAPVQTIFERPAIAWPRKYSQSEAYVVQYQVPKDSSVVLMVGLGVIVAAICVAVLLVWRPKAAKVPKEDEKNAGQQKAMLLEKINLMNVKEREVLKVVVERGQANQYELVAKLDLTKSNLSKIISSLERKGLIKRERHGKVNRIYPGERLK